MKLNKKILDNIDKFETIIKYKFSNKKYILEALTHSSYSNENKNYDFNERLEFLGDSILSIIVSDYLFKNEKDLPEGELTKLRANIVCEESLSDAANKIELGKYMLLGKGEEATGGRQRISILADAFEAVIAAIYLDGGSDAANKIELGKYMLLGKGEEATGGRQRISILADAFEAVIAAIYLDGGLESAKEFVLDYMEEIIIDSRRGKIFRDYKTHLQEVLQGQGESNIWYKFKKRENF